MSILAARPSSPARHARAWAVLAIAACPLLGACSSMNGQAGLDADAADKIAATRPDGTPRSEIEKATEYWGKIYAKSPSDPKAAVNYARNLKAMGRIDQALALMQQASQQNPSNREISSEYGRLALEKNQLGLADKLLQQAEDPTNPDWRVVSARGTVLAKQGKYKEAIPYYQRALALSPSQPSVLNNLALAQAMEGHAGEAETLLRRASSEPESNPRVRQNLALVLGLQGKYEEARAVGGKDLAPDVAAQNVAFVRDMVQVAPKPMSIATAEPARAEPQPTAPAMRPIPAAPAAPGSWDAKVATSSVD